MSGVRVKQAKVPWSEPGSGFTLWFEALVVALAREMPVRAVARLVGEHDTRLWRLLKRRVEFEGEIRRLRVNAGSSLSLPRSAMQDVTPLYRLREQILNDLAYQPVHTHGARPGIISFGKK